MFKNKRKIASVLFILISITLLAQGPNPPGNDKEPLPIDGGILIGAFVALFYGVKKLLKNI